MPRWGSSDAERTRRAASSRGGWSRASWDGREGATERKRESCRVSADYGIERENERKEKNKGWWWFGEGGSPKVKSDPTAKGEGRTAAREGPLSDQTVTYAPHPRQFNTAPVQFRKYRVYTEPHGPRVEMRARMMRIRGHQVEASKGDSL